MSTRNSIAVLCFAVLSTSFLNPHAAEPARIPPSTTNWLTSAKLSSNLETYNKGRRGAVDHMVYDLRANAFVKTSQYHEYGVGFGEDLGVVAESSPAWWMAEWSEPVEVNLISLSGVYPNQPQPDTAWRIELRRDDKWTEHARGVGGWYNNGRYVWGGMKQAPIRIDGFRVSVFSKDDKTPIKSIHFRGEEGVSWIVGNAAPIDAKIIAPSAGMRAGESIRVDGEATEGDIDSWKWDFGDGKSASTRSADHVFEKPGVYRVTLAFSDGEHSASVSREIRVAPPVEARIAPLTSPAVVGESIRFDASGSVGRIKRFTWDLGGDVRATGADCSHSFKSPGIYKVALTVTDGEFDHTGFMLLSVHEPGEPRPPQVVLDTDAKNEVDDQHYIAYALFSDLDVLCVNSIHHGGGQEPTNYGEILNIIDLAKQSKLAPDRVPMVFRGANERLKVPESGRWYDTEPIVTDASDAILAAARGASPEDPLWIVPVGPGTNTASAILQAHAQDLELSDRVRIMWLGGSNEALINEFNGNNDPWSMYVVSQSGVPTRIMPAPVSGRVRMDVRKEAGLYSQNPLGEYLKKIVPRNSKSLYDPTSLAAIISDHLDLGWYSNVEPVVVAGPKEGYRWTKTDDPATVHVIRDIDVTKMKTDIFETIKGRPRKLHP